MLTGYVLLHHMLKLTGLDAMLMVLRLPKSGCVRLLLPSHGRCCTERPSFAARWRRTSVVPVQNPVPRH